MEVETLAAETCWATFARPQQTFAFTTILCLYLALSCVFLAPQLESNS